jgi:hypothetical protein
MIHYCDDKSVGVFVRFSCAAKYNQLKVKSKLLDILKDHTLEWFIIILLLLN